MTDYRPTLSPDWHFNDHRVAARRAAETRLVLRMALYWAFALVVAAAHGCAPCAPCADTTTPAAKYGPYDSRFVRTENVVVDPVIAANFCFSAGTVAATAAWNSGDPDGATRAADTARTECLRRLAAGTCGGDLECAVFYGGEY